MGVILPVICFHCSVTHWTRLSYEKGTSIKARFWFLARGLLAIKPSLEQKHGHFVSFKQNK